MFGNFCVTHAIRDTEHDTRHDACLITRRSRASCACHGAYRLREPCGAATRAVAVDAGVCAAALRCCVDVWADECAHALRLGATVTALCLHGGWMLAGVGAREGRVEVWEPLEGRRVGTLAGRGAVAGLAVSGGALVRAAAAEAPGEGLVVLRSRPPMVAM